MKKNVTNIKDDKSFIEIINDIINLYKSKIDSNSIIESELVVYNEMIKIKDIALGKEKIKTSQENYISIQRVLDDMPSIGTTPIGEKIYDLVYYFAFVYKIPK